MLRLQQDQFRHDQRNHTDILCLAKNDRLKHYGLHFCKYVGRLARGSEEPISYERTVTDTALVALSAANTLHMHLAAPNLARENRHQVDPLRIYADAAGRFADACEKIDHAEEFLPIARKANIDIVAWTIGAANERGLDLSAAIASRRSELRNRQFFIRD
jgi:hypothetical protein